MTTWLVINGDDAGAHPKGDAGLIECARRGVLRSISLLANGANVEEMARWARSSGIGVGLHYNLTDGAPLSGASRTLTGPDGRFLGEKRAVWDAASSGRFDPEEIGREARAQWQRLIDLGLKPDHLDGHNHVHAIPAVFDALVRVLPGDRRIYVRSVEHHDGDPAAELPLPPTRLARDSMIGIARTTDWRFTDRLIGLRFMAEPRPENIDLDANRRRGVTEWMTHPSRFPGRPFASGRDRDAEKEYLCADSMLARLEVLRVVPVRFGDIP